MEFFHWGYYVNRAQITGERAHAAPLVKRLKSFAWCIHNNLYTLYAVVYIEARELLCLAHNIMHTRTWRP